MRLFKVRARVYKLYGPFLDTVVKVWARDEDHAERVAEYEIEAANKEVSFIEIRSSEPLGVDEALRRMGAAELPLRYE